MSHELTMNQSGRADMAYIGSRPWHGLGTLLVPGSDLSTWAAAAGLDWNCEVVPAMYEFNGTVRTAPSSFHMVRSDTGNSLSVMSRRYKPVQPSEILAFFRDFILTDDRFALETAGSLKGGRVIWTLARFNETLDVAGDKHACYVLLTTSFDGTLATTAQATMIRVVCNNTLTASVYQRGTAATVKVPHSVDFSRPDVQADCAGRLAEVAQSFTRYKAIGDALASVPLTQSMVQKLFVDLTVAKTRKAEASTKARNQLQSLVSSYFETLSEGTEPGTAWTALNAVTRYVDHDRTTRGGERMASSFFGSGAQLKAEALEALALAGGLELAKLGIPPSYPTPNGPTSPLPSIEDVSVDAFDFASLLA